MRGSHNTQRKERAAEYRVLSWRDDYKRCANWSSKSIKADHLDLGVHHSESFDGVSVDHVNLQTYLYRPEWLIINTSLDLSNRNCVVNDSYESMYRRKVECSFVPGPLQLFNSFTKDENHNHLVNASLAQFTPPIPMDFNEPSLPILDPFEVDSLLNSLSPVKQPLSGLCQIRALQAKSVKDDAEIRDLKREVEKLIGVMKFQKSYYDRELAMAKLPHPVSKVDDEKASLLSERIGQITENLIHDLFNLDPSDLLVESGRSSPTLSITSTVLSTTTMPIKISSQIPVKICNASAFSHSKVAKHKAKLVVKVKKVNKISPLRALMKSFEKSSRIVQASSFVRMARKKALEKVRSA